jgi:hypothetical protein
MKYVARSKSQPEERDLATQIDRLYQRGVLRSSYRTICHELRLLSNPAAHASEAKLKPDCVARGMPLWETDATIGMFH